MNEEAIEHCSPVLRQAQHLVVFTGAGVSAESGIPTFRDALTGLWALHDPMDLATPAAFERDPALVWGWYESRRLQLQGKEPNPAHHALANLASQVPRLTLITQNVDDLHERAGSTGVIHLHGDLQSPRCSVCAAPYAAAAELDLATTAQADGGRMTPPHCSQCNSPIRPGVVWFGESLPEHALQSAFEAAGRCDLLLSVGTSGVVQPAALIPDVAAQQGAYVIHINPEPNHGQCPEATHIQGRAGQILPELVARAFG